MDEIKKETEALHERVEKVRIEMENSYIELRKEMLDSRNKLEERIEFYNKLFYPNSYDKG